MFIEVILAFDTMWSTWKNECFFLKYIYVKSRLFHLNAKQQFSSCIRCFAKFFFAMRNSSSLCCLFHFNFLFHFFTLSWSSNERIILFLLFDLLNFCETWKFWIYFLLYFYLIFRHLAELWIQNLSSEFQVLFTINIYNYWNIFNSIYLKRCYRSPGKLIFSQKENFLLAL